MSTLNQSSFLPYYRNLLPKSIGNEFHSPKKTSKRCSSSSYRQRLKRMKTNCRLIRQRRRNSLFPTNPIELRPSLFQQRYYQSGSLESLHVSDTHWQSTNVLRLSDEYLFKCKYAVYSSTSRYFKQSEFYQFLKELFSYPIDSVEEEEEWRCQLCAQQFSTNEMFNLHYTRRSISIQYRCLTCHSWIKAMNPCEAYSHFLTHPDTSKEKGIEQLNIHCDWEKSLTFIDDLFAKYST